MVVCLRWVGARMNTTMHNKIVALHGESALRKSAMRIRGGAGAFEWAMTGKGYRTALEIGTYKGCTSAEMAQYCERVITIDLRYGKLEANGDKWDRAEFWKSLGIDNIEFHAIDDDRDKKLLVDAMDFDFAFIDGAHDRTVADDFELVKRCGHVLFHDADDNRLRPGKENKPNFVYEFISTLPKEQIQVNDIFALWVSA